MPISDASYAAQANGIMHIQPDREFANMVCTSVGRSLSGKSLVAGEAEGRLISALTGLSFWGGVDPQTGVVIDRHHPLHGECLTGKVLTIPSGRGSCSGSGVLLELILNDLAPAALVVCEQEEILTLGSLVSGEMFGRSMPVLQVERTAFDRLGDHGYARVRQDELQLFDTHPPDDWQSVSLSATPEPVAFLHLTESDRAFLSGEHGKAAQVAMRLLLKMATIQKAQAFVDVAQVHIDGCIYTGSAGLRFAELLVEWQGRVRVPTTLNAISVDKRRWRAQGVPEALGVPAAALADAYLAMGALPSFTCAPYLLESVPMPGDHIGWAESNAVIYANSVIGARTMKYPDFLDICIALTGRAPLAGCHLEEGRRATVELDVTMPERVDDAFWPLLGYSCGVASGSDIPVIRGLEASAAGRDALKAFAAAFGMTAAAPMFHIAGITPEAGTQHAERRVSIGREELQAAWRELNTAAHPQIGLVSLGSPHFSLTECAELARLVQNRTKSRDVAVIVTCGRAVYEDASQAGYIGLAEGFGVQFVTDTCWCMLGEPVVPVGVKTLMTNSAKYAHYAPGLVGRSVRFGSLSACVEAACDGMAGEGLPVWLL